MNWSVLTGITQAVADSLNDGDFEQTFTAVRSVVPVYDTSVTQPLKVFVTPGAQVMDVAAGTRSESEDTYTVAVGIYGQIDRGQEGDPDADQVDQMMFFVQQVIDHLKLNDQLAVASGDDTNAIQAATASLIAIKNNPVIDLGTLREKGTFVSGVLADYRLYR
jgi:hypothetical protein